MKKTSKKTEVKKVTKKTTKKPVKKAAKKSTKKIAKKTSSKKIVAKKKPAAKKSDSTQKKVKKLKEEPAVIDSNDPEVLLGERRHPRGWKIMTYEQKLDYIATRMLAEDRHGVTSHKKLKESGILSVSQYERRRNREVYSQEGDLDSIKVKRGVFNRAHVRDIRGVRNTPKAPEETVDE